VDALLRKFHAAVETGDHTRVQDVLASSLPQESLLYSRAGGYCDAESAFVGVAIEDIRLLNRHMLCCVSEKSMS